MKIAEKISGNTKALAVVFLVQWLVFLGWVLWVDTMPHLVIYQRF